MNKYGLLFLLSIICVQGCDSSNPEYERCLRQVDSSYDRCEVDAKKNMEGTGVSFSLCGTMREIQESHCEEEFKTGH